MGECLNHQPLMTWSPVSVRGLLDALGLLDGHRGRLFDVHVLAGGQGLKGSGRYGCCAWRRSAPRRYRRRQALGRSRVVQYLASPCSARSRAASSITSIVATRRIVGVLRRFGRWLRLMPPHPMIATFSFSVIRFLALLGPLPEALYLSPVERGIDSESEYALTQSLSRQACRAGP